MTVALGVKAPLDLLVYSASAGAFLLAAYGTIGLASMGGEYRREGRKTAQKLQCRPIGGGFLLENRESFEACGRYDEISRSSLNQHR